MLSSRPKRTQGGGITICRDGIPAALKTSKSTRYHGVAMKPQGILIITPAGNLLNANSKRERGTIGREFRRASISYRSVNRQSVGKRRNLLNLFF
jgi:hypothetical protein